MNDVKKTIFFSSLSVVSTIVTGTLMTGAIVAAVAAGSAVATVALSVAAVVAGILLLISLGSNLFLFIHKNTGSFEQLKLSYSTLPGLIEICFQKIKECIGTTS